MRVGLIVAEGCFTSGLAALLDILNTAEALRPVVDPAIAPLEITVAGFRKRVTTSAGLTVATDCVPGELSGVDVVAIPAVGTKGEDDVQALLDSRDVRRMVTVVGPLRDEGCTLAAACTAVFPLAQSGVLDGHRATTTWWLGAAFKRRFPAVHLDLDSMVVTDADMVTAGAAFSHIDLALTLVRRVSASLADTVARHLVIDERPAQSVYVAVDHLSHSDPTLVAFERYVRAHLSDALDVAGVAAALGTSRRTLERRIDAAVGMSPLSLIQQLRVERATHLLRTSDRGMDDVAAQVGYANASTLRTLLRRFRGGSGRVAG